MAMVGLYSRLIQSKEMRAVDSLFIMLNVF